MRLPSDAERRLTAAKNLRRSLEKVIQENESLETDASEEVVYHATMLLTHAAHNERVLTTFVAAEARALRKQYGEDVIF